VSLVQSPEFRTYDQFRFRSVGHYRVRLVNRKGRILGEREFDVQ